MNTKTDIEEDIKICNTFIKSIRTDLEEEEEDNFETANAIENILAYIERIDKENKKLTYARNWYFEHTVGQIATPEMLSKILRTQYNTEELQDKVNKYDSLVEKIKDKAKKKERIKRHYRSKNNIRIKFMNTDVAKITEKELEINDKHMQLIGEVNILQELLDTVKEK